MIRICVCIYIHYEPITYALVELFVFIYYLFEKNIFILQK
jgi:hypothetical protein